MEDISLLREKMADRVGEDTPHRRPVWRGVDTYPCATANAKDASELLEPESRVREELQAELACNGIETTVPERQCLTVTGHRPKRRFVQPLARCCQHRGRDVRADHEARSSDDRESHQSGLSRS